MDLAQRINASQAAQQLKQLKQSLSKGLRDKSLDPYHAIYSLKQAYMSECLSVL
jgi:hypothetical protein